MTGSALSPNIPQQAGGGLLNQPGTPKISNNAIGGFQLTIFLENLESAFFQEGLMNYTQWSSGDQTAGVTPSSPDTMPSSDSTAGEVPNPTTFETKISPDWAFNLALDFINPKTCSNLPEFLLSIPIYPDLGIFGYGVPSSATPNGPGKLIFKMGQPNMLPQGWNQGQLYMAWVNQKIVPAYTPVTVQGSELHADVQPGMFGIAYAALTNQNTATNADD